MAPLGINNFNFRNSQLNYTYSIYCLIKIKNKTTSKLLWENNSLEKFQFKSCFKFVLLTKKFKENN